MRCTFDSRFLIALAALLLGGCASVARPKFPLPTDPKPVLVATSGEQWFQAEWFAYGENGHVYEIEPTGSMEPTLTGGDFVVIVPKKFSEYVVNDVLLYDALWHSLDVMHRIFAIDAKGFVMWGDANPYPESEYRVDAKHAKGKLVGIWRIQKP